MQQTGPSHSGGRFLFYCISYYSSSGTSTRKNTSASVPTLWAADTQAANKMTVAANGSATAEENIVAPGTKSAGTGMAFGISGKPEVAVTVDATIKARDINLTAGTYGVMVPACCYQSLFLYCLFAL